MPKLRPVRNSLLPFAIGVLLLISQTAIASVIFGSQKVPEEAGISHGAYIAPNEMAFQGYESVLGDRPGVLISVGTFRTLDRSAAGQFSHVFMIDYDQRTTDFNRLNLDLIAKSKDRYEYLRLLLSRPLDQQLLDSVRSSLITDRQYIDALRQTAPSSAVSPKLFEQLQAPLFPDDPMNKKTIMDSLAGRLEVISFTTELRQSSIFLSDTVFEKVKTNVLRGGYTPVNASLTGKKTLKKLAEVLQKQRLRVSVVDISNVLDHVYFKSKRTPKQFLANLQALPLTENALVLLTTHKFGFEGKAPVGDSWSYVALPAISLLKAGELGHLANAASYSDFLDVVFKHRLDEAWTKENLLIPGPSYALDRRASLAKTWCRSQANSLLTSVWFRAWRHYRR